MEEELVTVCIGGRFCDVPKSIAKDIFTTITETPPIDYENSQKEVNEIAANIRKAKEEGTY